jgi:hypothetical protein
MTRRYAGKMRTRGLTKPAGLPQGISRPVTARMLTGLPQTATAMPWLPAAVSLPSAQAKEAKVCPYEYTPTQQDTPEYQQTSPGILLLEQQVDCWNPCHQETIWPGQGGSRLLQPGERIRQKIAAKVARHRAR